MFGIMILIKQRDINISFIKDQIKDYLIMGEKSTKIFIKKKVPFNYTFKNQSVSRGQRSMWTLMWYQTIMHAIKRV